MRILHAYITHGFLMTFGMTLLVFLFVMAIGNIFKVIDLFSRGVSGRLILEVFSYGIPFSLIFAIPMSVLAAVFLQFNRISGDREITAMRACGINIWNIIKPPFLISLLLAAVCIYINCNVAPDSHYARRKVLSKLGVETPISLLDEGRFIRDFPGLTVYIGKKEGARIRDIVINQVDKNGVKRTIRAAAGTVATATNEPGKIMVTLYRVRIEQPDEQHPENLALTRYLNAEEYPLIIDIQELINRDVVWKKRADLRMSEIINALTLSARFAPRDFIAPDRIIAKLKDQSDPASAYLRTKLSQKANNFLETFDGSPPKQKQARRMLAAEFNQIISGDYLYATNVFTGINLSKRTTDFMQRFQPGACPAKFNRMLIEDIFPEQIVKNTSLDTYPEDLPVLRTALLVEANTRLTLSCSCFAFVLLGAALGIKIHRKESSIGIAVSLLLVFIFYFFIIIADSLESRPEFYPHIIVWFPFVLSLGLGSYLIQRSN